MKRALLVFVAPFRLRRLHSALRHWIGAASARRVWWWTRPRDIAAFCETLPPGVVPGSGR